MGYTSLLFTYFTLLTLHSVQCLSIIEYAEETTIIIIIINEKINVAFSRRSKHASSGLGMIASRVDTTKIPWKSYSIL